LQNLTQNLRPPTASDGNNPHIGQIDPIIVPLTIQDVQHLHRAGQAFSFREHRAFEPFFSHLGNAALPDIYHSELSVLRGLHDSQPTHGDQTTPLIPIVYSENKRSHLDIKELGDQGVLAFQTLIFFSQPEHLRLLNPVDPPAFSTPEQYLEHYWQKHTTREYINYISRIAGELPPPDRECLATICIPVADLEEGAHIYRTLNAFLNQTVRPEQFEILLYLNHIDAPKYEDTAEADYTVQEIKRFQREHPEAAVNYFCATIKPELARIGYIRKVLNDVALLRYQNRGDLGDDPILIRADADTWGVHRRFIETYLRQFSRNPEVDAFKGPLDWEWPSQFQDPLLVFGLRLNEILPHSADLLSNETSGHGPNFAVRATSYAAAGGYMACASLGEDIYLAQQLKAMRLGSTTKTAIKYAGGNARLWTSARRATRAFELGHAPLEQWSNKETPFRINDPKIRREQTTPDKLRSYDEILDGDDFVQRADSILNSSIAAYHSWRSPWASIQPTVDQLERIFGIKIEISTAGKLKLVNADGLRTFLRRFAQNGPQHWADNLQFPVR